MYQHPAQMRQCVVSLIGLWCTSTDCEPYCERLYTAGVPRNAGRICLSYTVSAELDKTTGYQPINVPVRFML